MFFGRDDEIRALRGLIEAPKPQIAVVYGRRRIGKTSLISNATDKSAALVIEGIEGGSKQEQIESFLGQVSEQLRRDLTGRAPASWQEALLILHRALGRRRMVIVFDEFQWLANYRQELVSALKMVWENYLSRAPGRSLILCGSIASFMTTRVIRSSAFYGRTDLVIHLQGFRLGETAAMLKRHGFGEVLDAQSFTSGVPKYLEMLAAAPSIQTGIERLAFRRDGYFVGEHDRVFVSHFGSNSDMERIVRALVASPYGLSRRELAARAGVNEGGGLSNQLFDLEAAGFIHSHRPLDKVANSRLIRYFLTDGYLRFFYAFIRPRLKQIRAGGRQRDHFAGIRQGGAFRSWMGRAFELVCIDHTDRIAELLGFSGVDYEVGPWFRAPRKGLPGVQIDLAFDRGDRVITLCEMKRQTAPLGKAVIAEVERKAALLEAEHPRKTIQRVLVVDGDVSREVTNSGYFFRIIQAKDMV